MNYVYIVSMTIGNLSMMKEVYAARHDAINEMKDMARRAFGESPRYNQAVEKIDALPCMRYRLDGGAVTLRHEHQKVEVDDVTIIIEEFVLHEETIRAEDYV